MTFAIIINGVLALLLLATLVYLFKVNASLAAVRSNQTQLESQVARLSDATERAQTALHMLRAGALEVSDLLQERTRTGRVLADELEIAITAAGRLSDRLASAIETRTPAPRGSAKVSALADRLKGVR